MTDPTVSITADIIIIPKLKLLWQNCYRLKHLLGYGKNDLEGKTPFVLQHHEDTVATMKCSEGGMYGEISLYERTSLCLHACVFVRYTCNL